MAHHHQVTFSDAEQALLDRVRQQEGLASVADAVEWLVKRRLRRLAAAVDGRKRGPRLATLGGKPQ